VEHSAILRHVEDLARRGYEITRLPVARDGRISPDSLVAALRDDTALVTIMWANNETGVISPVADLAEICLARRVSFHVDAVQAVGKVLVDLRALPGVTYLSLSGHKMHAPKGVGALYVRQGAPLTNYFRGGGQQHERRAGTENVASIVALGRAAEMAADALAAGRADLIASKRDRFEREMITRVSGIEVNGAAPRVPNTTNLYFPNLESGSLLLLFDKENLAASAGSACLSGSVHPSHVLSAMGFSTERARSSLRFSLSRLTTDDEIDRAIEIIPQAVSKLRAATAEGPVLAAR
jgi:cysteine desulfurase